MTVLEAIQRSTEFLIRKGVEAPRLQAELMLAKELGLPRLKLYLNFERVLLDPEVDRLRQMVKRRGEREPLQHILGATSFCGLEFTVNRDVLIPRPETEILAEAAWKHLVGLSDAQKIVPRVLDFGTGSGCLAVTLAVKCPRAEITAIDISHSVLAVARQNAARHQVLDRIQFLEGDHLVALPGEQRFEFIVSNPPYIPSSTIPGLQPEVRDFDPRLALDGGEDGLRVIRQLAAEGLAFLVPGGHVMMEFGDGQDQSVRELFAANGWVVKSVVPDYSGTPRILIAHSPVS